ncbi:MAG TPA: DUF177 domain-containing protein [Paludibacteraceae bacterium]|jgi:uncharacterized metal-binding protein YceD (DUF177 family)|nr:DUF177 domain-containing protein [Paludibacteraceae bacterium]OPZ03313.1 MAG: hypothetical protein BWZ11_00199 [Bacteroidetes bacterium ADurb.BinA395]HOF98412.1 DUF177 domain-containing protein [Paludibacteraceae bacterium]HOJ65373.1 DUF177 domain-containing protein [Paludibacteraceae bacterium]HOL30156.1 DUF177 domain-containing protein [Paludibacteraceae bacterium]
MSKFELYNIVLKDLTNEKRIVEFDLDDAYFQKIDSPEVQQGNVHAKITVQKKTTVYKLDFELNGFITLPCSRCLEDMQQLIHYKESLEVKFGNKFSEENDIVIVPEADGAINVAWFLYEFIVLNIPLKHVHAPGECNKAMITKLKKHISSTKEYEDETSLELEDTNEDDYFSNNQFIDLEFDNLQNIDN